MPNLCQMRPTHEAFCLAISNNDSSICLTFTAKIPTNPHEILQNSDTCPTAMATLCTLVKLTAGHLKMRSLQPMELSLPVVFENHREWASSI